jgi:hypothetical protein
MNINGSFDGVRALTLAEVDEVSGGAKNSDSPLVQVFLKAFENAQKKAAAEVLELARNSGGSLGSTYGKF